MTTPDHKRKVPKRARGLGGHVPAPCRFSAKHSWLSRQDAVQAGRKAGGALGLTFRAYKCRKCRQYHLTSQPKRPR